MALELYFHPLASFCHKVLIALYENEVPFTPHVIDFTKDNTAFFALWPVGKIPVLRDGEQTIPETSIIIEHIDRRGLIPSLEARLWDRFFDNYVQVPMQKIVTDRLRPAGASDPHGVAEARETLRTAYAMLEDRLSGRTWVMGDAFTIADCAAAPALFYALVVEPFSGTNTNAYFERLLKRPSFARVLDEAKPYLKNFPYFEALPARFKA